MSLALLAAAAGFGQPSSCFWSYPRNLPLVETNARYWRGEFELRPGERLEISGAFPHARQMGFNIHRLSDNAALASAADVNIPATRGSTNPYAPGARRDARRRDFRLVLDPAAPSSRPGLLALPATGDGSRAYRILYRYYLPDGRHPGGGVTLPRVSRLLADGRREPVGGACPDPATVDPTQPTGPTRLPAAPGEVSDPIDWRGSATPAGSGSGELLVNRDNAYAYAYTDMRKGEVLVLRGRAPRAPRTLGGERKMDAGHVRYWSICSYRHPSDRSAACIADELVPLDADGNYTIVISPAGMRPANARPECGIQWLDALTEGTGAVLLRHVWPSRGFIFTPLTVTAEQSAARVLGPYTPVGSYRSRAEVEALGCSNQR